MKEIKIEKKKVVFTQTPPECMINDFGVEEDELCTRKGCICGNKDFKEYGDNRVLEIVKNEYYDEEEGYEYELFDELKKVMGVEYDAFDLMGYSQGDWNIVYLPKNENNSKYVEWLEAMYFGKYDEYCNEDYYAIPILHSIAWKSPDAIKEEIACSTGLSVDEITLKKFTGYKKIAEYEEV